LLCVFYCLAVYVPGGADSINALPNEPDAIHFVEEAFRHCKAISAMGEGINFIKETAVRRAAEDDAGIILSEKIAKDTTQNFINAIAEHRN
jgi:catalase